MDEQQSGCVGEGREDQRGESSTPADLLAAVYEQLRRLAASYLDRERADHTLQPTALVHEAYLKLMQRGTPAFRDSAHFRALAAQSMRQILVDYARKRHATKRGGNRLRVTLSDATPRDHPPSGVDVLGLHEALNRLALLDSRKSRVVELRFFGGMTCAEVAASLNVSPKTVESDWSMARAWLRVQLSEIS